MLLDTNLLPRAGITHYSQLHDTRSKLIFKVATTTWGAPNLIINALLAANADRKLGKSPSIWTVNNWRFPKLINCLKTITYSACYSTTAWFCLRLLQVCWGMPTLISCVLDILLLEKDGLKCAPLTRIDFSSGRPYFSAKILVWGTKIFRIKIPVTGSLWYVRTVVNPCYVRKSVIW